MVLISGKKALVLVVGSVATVLSLLRTTLVVGGCAPQWLNETSQKSKHEADGINSTNKPLPGLTSNDTTAMTVNASVPSNVSTLIQPETTTLPANASSSSTTSTTIDIPTPLFWGQDILFHYSAQDWDYPETWAMFGAYCAISNCQNVVVQGNCGYNSKMCKRLTHLGVAALSRSRTLFVDNDFLISTLNNDNNIPSNHSAFDENCAAKPFSIACRFDRGKGKLRKAPNDAARKIIFQRTNSGVMCINFEHLATDAFLDYYSIYDVTGRCHDRSSSDQFAYYKVMKQLHEQGQVHCIDETKYGFKATQPGAWNHYWGDKVEVGLPQAIQKTLQGLKGGFPSGSRTIVLHLQAGGFRVDRIEILHWQLTNDGKVEANKQILKGGMNLQSEGMPSKEQIRRHKDYLMPIKEELTQACVDALNGTSFFDQTLQQMSRK